MNLIRFSPASSLLPAFSHGRLLDELDRLFDAGFPASRPARGEFPVDIYEDREAVHVRAELPGFRKEDLQVGLADDVLTLSAQIAAGGEQKSDGKTEASVQRRIALPENLDYAKVSAAYENGVLNVSLAKREEAKPATIAIEVK